MFSIKKENIFKKKDEVCSSDSLVPVHGRKAFISCLRPGTDCIRPEKQPRPLLCGPVTHLLALGVSRTPVLPRSCGCCLGEQEAEHRGDWKAETAQDLEGTQGRVPLG